MTSDFFTRDKPSKTFFRTVFLSDIHLGNRDCHAEYLLQYLSSIECEQLYLVGDIIDMLAMKKRVFWPQSHAAILQQIYTMAKQGTEVIYIPGNHDRPLRNFDSGFVLNIQLHHQRIHTTAQGKRLLVLHGDEFDHAVVYRALIRVIGDPAYDFMVFMNRWLQRIRGILALPFWSLASYLKENLSQAAATIEAFENAAADQAREYGLDGVICGHIHRACMREINGVLYCNDGDWTESCTALIETADGELQLLQWQDIERVCNFPTAVISRVA